MNLPHRLPNELPSILHSVAIGAAFCAIVLFSARGLAQEAATGDRPEDAAPQASGDNGSDVAIGAPQAPVHASDATAQDAEPAKPAEPHPPAEPAEHEQPAQPGQPPSEKPAEPVAKDPAPPAAGETAEKPAAEAAPTPFPRAFVEKFAAHRDDALTKRLLAWERKSGVYRGEIVTKNSAPLGWRASDLSARDTSVIAEHAAWERGKPGFAKNHQSIVFFRDERLSIFLELEK
ncbi:MAG: hypothetical protein L0Z55_05845 [Planctomycetes bacterium]|nr:hypothetical protein [Planctomycetota bacterium]